VDVKPENCKRYALPPPPSRISSVRLNYDPDLKRIVRIGFMTEDNFAIEVGTLTPESFERSHKVEKELIGIYSQTIYSSFSNQFELDSIAFIFNDCPEGENVPVVTEYLATKYGGDSSASSIRYVNSNKDLKNKPVHDEPSKWTYVTEVAYIKKTLKDIEEEVNGPPEKKKGAIDTDKLDSESP